MRGAGCGPRKITPATRFAKFLPRARLRVRDGFGGGRMEEERDAGRIVAFLADWLRGRIEEAGAGGAVFGLSGGIDSAVVCGLAARAVGPERCLGVIMPIGNVREDEELGREVARTFGVRAAAPDLLPAFEALESALRAERDALGFGARDEAAARLSAANLKPRLRMTALYHFANLKSWLVVGTGNRAELTVGYFTKHGDAGVDLLPLAGLTKGQVRAAARALGVPARVIGRPPSAGLWEGQTDEEELGLRYDDIDRFLSEGSSGDAAADAEIRRRFQASAHKRAPAPAALLPSWADPSRGP
jgi:NAD+ synthase